MQVRAVIPRRSSLAGERGVLIVSYSMHKLKTVFFFLLQVRCLFNCTFITELALCNWLHWLHAGMSLTFSWQS